ncbi:MAG: RNA polymerase sigma factor [Thermomicrobiales bacterium]
MKMWAANDYSSVNWYDWRFGTVHVQPQQSSSLDLKNSADFADFFSETSQRVYGYFFARVGGERQLAEDLTQETFLAAARELARGVAVLQPQPWLFGIAHHKLLDYFREKTSHAVAPEEIIIADQSPLDWPELTLKLATEEKILKALRAVPSPQREALILHFMDDMTVADVARQLGRTRSAAESLIWRGRVAFHRHYLESDSEESA